MSIYPMTVVIATLGGPSLISTIEALQRGSLTPEEILICIPATESKRVSNLVFPNVKIVLTHCRGQVAQRAVGFRHASYPIVMQLDDDLLVDIDCIHYLLKTLQAHGPNISVAPALMNSVTGKSIYKKRDRFRVLQKMCYWIMNGSDGYQPGKICKSGLAIGIDPGNKNQTLFEVEWLAGGCILHYKKNLLLTNFYPFSGKAFCEDLLHSCYLMQSKIKLMVDSNAECWVEPASLNYGFLEFLQQLYFDFRARKYTLLLFSRFSFRIYLYYFARYFHFIYQKILKYEK
jgi:glycosyltransferase involved in cell wall biosynthesis